MIQSSITFCEILYLDDLTWRKDCNLWWVIIWHLMLSTDVWASQLTKCPSRVFPRQMLCANPRCQSFKITQGSRSWRSFPKFKWRLVGQVKLRFAFNCFFRPQTKVWYNTLDLLQYFVLSFVIIRTIKIKPKILPWSEHFAVGINTAMVDLKNLTYSMFR